MSQLILFALLFLGSLASAQQQCATLHTELQTDQPRLMALNISKLGYSWTHLDQYLHFSYWGRKKVLFLSDNGKASHLGNKDDRTFFVSTDISHKNGIALRMDNNHFPFAQGVFDVIIMNRGLCACDSVLRTCGGIALEASAIKSFLQNVSLALNPTNPNSIALLTGFHFVGDLGAKVPGLFVSQLTPLQREFPQFEYVPLVDPVFGRQGGFIGIAIHTKGRSLVENLKLLVPPAL